jgi:HSP20 family molecular chaperone IbpA
MAESQYPVSRRQGAYMPSPFEMWNTFFSRPFSLFPSLFGPTSWMGLSVPVDVCERDNDYVVRMACAGCRPQDIDVTVENDTVHIRGKFMEHEGAMQATPTSQAGQAKGGETCLIRELPTGRFERDITLPTNVNADQARASFDNGLLTLTLPKAQAAHGHKIQIGQGQLQGTATGAH